MSGNTISLAMIVKNEASRLGSCLESVKALVDEIIIVDTGSTDSTLQVARQYTNKVYLYEWQGDFSAARNFAIAQATGDWLLSLDADETLLCDAGQLKDLVSEDKNIEAYMLPLEHPINELTGEVNHFLVLRLFRNKPEYYFLGKIHEQVVVKNPQVVGIAGKAKIKHALLPAKERNHKKKRNLAYLRSEIKADPENLYLNYYLGVEWLGLGKPQLAVPLLAKAYQNLTDDFIMFKSAALRYLLTSLILLREYDKIICLGQEAALNYPDYADLFYLTGCSLEEKGEYKVALKWFDKAIESGTPAILFSHLQGTENFLSHYHRGFCYEMINNKKLAEQCYEQALQENNQYHYPSCSLFKVKFVRYGLEGALVFFRGKNFYNNPQIAYTVAELFYKLGYPNYAKRCLSFIGEANLLDFELIYLQGKYHVLAGEIEAGREYLEHIPTTSRFFGEAQLLITLGFLIMGKDNLVRSSALKLWGFKELRVAARFFNKLSHWLLKGLPSQQELQYEQAEITGFGLKLLDLCHHYHADFASKTPAVGNLIRTLQGVLSLLPGGAEHLSRYYLERIVEVNDLLKSRF